MFADENDGKARSAAGAFAELGGDLRYALAEIRRDRFAVDDASGHAVPVTRSTATPLSSMRRIWISSRSTSGEKSMPPKSGITLRIGR